MNPVGHQSAQDSRCHPLLHSQSPEEVGGGKSHLMEKESTKEGLPETEGMGCQAGCPVEGRVTGGSVLCLAEGSPGTWRLGTKQQTRGLECCVAQRPAGVWGRELLKYIENGTTDPRQ